MFGTNRLDVLEALSQLHREELMNEARAYRLSRKEKSPRPSFWRQSTWKLGSLLVSFGSWLQCRSRAFTSAMYR